MNRRDMIAAAIFIFAGLFFCIYAWLEFPIGRAVEMGPGYFPVMLGLLLIGLGLLVGFNALSGEDETASPVSWRGVILVTASIVFFAVTIRGLGLVPALSVAVLVAAFASPQVTVRSALALSVGLTGFCLIVFVYALKVPIDLFGPWLRGA